jgi:3-oxoacyl-[acyl-carrier-protein] synthase III
VSGDDGVVSIRDRFYDCVTEPDTASLLRVADDSMRVAISGCGLTDFGRSAEGVVDLALAAAHQALDQSGATTADVDAMYFSTFASAVLSLDPPWGGWVLSGVEARMTS